MKSKFKQKQKTRISQCAIVLIKYFLTFYSSTVLDLQLRYTLLPRFKFNTLKTQVRPVIIILDHLIISPRQYTPKPHS